MTPAQTTGTLNAPLLHRFLLTGLVALAAVFVFIRLQGVSLLPPEDGATSVIAYTMAAAVAAMLAVGLLVLKPRVPARPTEQTVEAYWSTKAVAERASLVWFVLEGAGIVANLGYLLTGEAVSAFVMAAALAAFWWCGPNTFAKP